MVDLTKSYIGGTQQGIVLDMKVGPSVHLEDYAASFNRKLISYTRGGNTAEIPENQSIGTMQETAELRKSYAEKFNAKVKGLAEADPNAAWFNQITGYHGRSYQQTKQWLDVATKAPSGKAARPGEFAVSAPGVGGQGPFRVFKRASDQSNKSGAKTTPEEVQKLAAEVWEKELLVSGGDPAFLKKAEAAKDLLPSQ